jgi:hypothetical protein
VWYENGGFAHVSAYLHQHDISRFDAKAPPQKTAAFWSIIDANRPAEAAELADAIEQLPDAAAFTLVALKNVTSDSSLAGWLDDRKNRRTIPHRLEKCGYVPIRNDTAKDGLWIVNKKRQVVHAKASLEPREQLKAAKKIVAGFTDQSKQWNQ